MGAEPLAPARSRPGAEHASLKLYYSRVVRIQPIDCSIASNSYISKRLTLWPDTSFLDVNCDDQPQWRVDVDEMVVSCRRKIGSPKRENLGLFDFPDVLARGSVVDSSSS